MLIKLPSLRVSLYYLSTFFTSNGGAIANFCHQEKNEWNNTSIADWTKCVTPRSQDLWSCDLSNFRLKSYIPQLQLFFHPVWSCHRYNPSFIFASTWIQPSQPISTSFLRRRSHMCLNEPSQIEQKCLNTSLEDYLQVNALPDSMVVEREE